jgi:hypothetical protein
MHHRLYWKKFPLWKIATVPTWQILQNRKILHHNPRGRTRQEAQ